MKKRYKLPISGTVVRENPLEGDKTDPICVIPLGELPTFPTFFELKSQEQIPESFSYTCLNYNLDEEWCEVELEASEAFHNWLAGILPQLKDIQKEKGRKLDKTRLESK